MSDYKEWVPHESKDYPDSYEDSCWNNDPNRAKYKIRETDTAINASGGSYIYMAFADEPLVANVGASIPATAR